MINTKTTLELRYIFFTISIYCTKYQHTHTNNKKHFVVSPQVYRVRTPSVFLRKFLIYIKDVSEGRQSYIEYGVCSYYHDKFHHRKTATGDKFDQRMWTGAHRTLPIPSIILVCFLDKEKKVKGIIILLNDRGPYAKKRILDLSYSGAKNLEMTQCGHKKVAVFFLKNETIQLHRNNRAGKVYSPPYLGILDQEQIIAVLKKNDIILQ